jgi:hypothetical protein
MASTPSIPSFPPTILSNLSKGRGEVAPEQGGKEKKVSGADREILSAAVAIDKLMDKILGMKKEAKPYVDEVKASVKKLVVECLKMDPSALGGEHEAGAESAAGSPEIQEAPPPSPMGARGEIV